MRNRRCILIAIVLGALAMGAVLFLVRPSEPYYDGHPLSYWVELYGGQQSSSYSEENQALASLRLDTRALPYLLKWIEYPPEETQSAAALHEFLERLDNRLRNPFGLYRRYRYKPYELATGAPFALVALGPEAAPAVPALERLLHTSTREETRVSVSFVLANMGERGLRILTAALTNRNPDVRYTAVHSMVYLGTNATLVIPLILDTLGDTEVVVANWACTTLDNLHIDPDLIVPRLIQRLGDSNAQMRAWAVMRLGSFYRSPSHIMPALQAALKDSSHEVRFAATNALQTIAPELLGNAPP